MHPKDVMALNGTALYDSLGGAQRMQAMLDRVLRQFRETTGEPLAMNLRWWKMQWLESPDDSAHARHDAAASDLLLIALASPEPIMGSLKALVEDWAARRQAQKPALLAVLAEPGANSRTVAFLRRTARRCGVDCLCAREGEEDASDREPAQAGTSPAIDSEERTLHTVTAAPEGAATFRR